MSRRKRANLSDLLNNLTFKVLYDKYKLLCLEMYEWEGLPEGVKPKYIEEYLFSFGKCIFFKAPGMSYMCLQADGTGKLNQNNEELYWRATGNKYTKVFPADKCVIIDNNILRLPTDDVLMFYINKMYEAERTMDVNVKAVKTPTVFAVDQKDLLTFKALFSQVDGNVPAIFVDKNLNLDNIGVFNTGATFMCNDLMDYKKQVENELLTFLGFNNVAVDKKERVNVPETESNNELIESFADLGLKARQKACEDINKLYPDLHISVKRKVKEVSDNVDNKPVRDDNENRQTS